MSFPPFVLLVLLPTILVDSAAPPVLPSATFTAPKDDLPDGISELKLLTASDAGLMHGRLVMTEGPGSMLRSFFRLPNKWNTFVLLRFNSTTSVIAVEDAFVRGVEHLPISTFGKKICELANTDRSINMTSPIELLHYQRTSVDGVLTGNSVLDIFEVLTEESLGLQLSLKSASRTPRTK
ncbi:hypothetical protein FOZ61_006151 [Perkinsus olseni]|uniref:Uncharacterized protein n=1 Tax=Perkinsus olseni TaxID=32597 RepID=A0A7J6M3Z3_PEROL|nr:hypothetical protein FOZ61_006151 [Perkinsus olseni]KAF4666293.1 hypothetical protein FOL46_003145 [Perkinsus olseni]